MKQLLKYSVIAIGAIVVFMRYRAYKSEEMKIERFAKVPSTPNCVSSEAPAGDPHFIEPLKLTKSVADAKAALRSHIEGLPRSKLVVDEGDYLRFEFRSAFFSFIDDVEFRFDEATRTVRVRSASRVGRSDFGVNRKRVESLRAALADRI